MNTEAGRKPARKMTRAEVIKANDLMMKFIEKLSDGTVQYKDGWDDGKIALAVASDMPRTSIANLRVELFGALKKEGYGSGVDPARLAALELEVAALKERLNVLADLHSKLCDNLSVNRVVDVRHLKGVA